MVITNSSEAKNLNENEYFTAYFNDVKYGMTDYYEDLDGNGAAEVVQRAEIKTNNIRTKDRVKN